MGFFNSSSSAPAVNIDELINDDSLNIHEGMSLMEAAYAGIAESEMNWNAIMEAVAMSEMEEMSTTGSDYSAIAEAGFFSSVVSFFKKIWEKIKSLFKKFMVMLGSMVGKDRDFAKKHGDTIRAAIKNIPSDAEIKGYKFTTNDLKSDIEAASSELNTELASLSKGGAWESTFSKYKLGEDSFDSSDANELLRGKICSKMQTHSDRMTDSEMREAAFARARNKEDSPVDIKLDATLVAACLNELEGGDKAKSDAKKLYSTQEKTWKSAMKTAEDFEKQGYKDFKDKNSNPNGDQLKQITRALQLCKTKASCIQTLCAVYLQAVKDQYSQCRKACVRVVTFRTAKEGAQVTHYTEGAFMTPNMI